MKKLALVFSILMLLTVFSVTVFADPAPAPDTYTVTYHVGDGQNPTENPATYTAPLTEDIELLPATRDEYVFVGWFT